MAALADMRRAGKLAAIGPSNVTVAQLDEAARIVPIAAVQNPLRVGGRGDAVLLRRCEELDVAYFAYAPLRGVAIGAEAVRRFPATARLAQRRGVSVQRLLLRGLLASSPALSVVVGAGRKATAVDSAAAMTEAWDEESQAAYDADHIGGGSLR